MAEYFRQMLVLALPAAIIFCCFYPYRHRALTAQQLHSGFLREFGLILFVMSLFGVLAVTLEPAWYQHPSDGMWGDIVLLVDRPDPLFNVNLRPFRMVTLYWNTFQNGDYFFTLINLVGNLCVFVPIGFFPALLFRQGTWLRSFCIGFGVSFLVECGQYFLGRTSDVDDIILNTLGALTGYWLYLLIKKLFPKLCTAFLCRRN